MKATYTSRCGICGEPIHEGDEIAEVDGEWVHVECGRDEGYLEDEP